MEVGAGEEEAGSFLELTLGDFFVAEAKKLAAAAALEVCDLGPLACSWVGVGAGWEGSGEGASI
jgi:hypothetical protein